MSYPYSETVSGVAPCPEAWPRSTEVARAPRWLAWCLLACMPVVLAEGIKLTQSLFDWVAQQYGETASARVARLKTLVENNQSVAESRKLEQVNLFFNKVPYDSDWQLWEKEDYWATPIEMLGKNGADCEDYAIAKYFTLRELGVPAKRLRITYVKALRLDQAHMILAYYPKPDAEPMILDNLENTIRTAGDRADLVPVYSFNGESLWLAKSRKRGIKVGGSHRIKLWNNLRSKMEQEEKQ